MGPQHWTCSGV